MRRDASCLCGLRLRRDALSGVSDIYKVEYVEQRRKGEEFNGVFSGTDGGRFDFVFIT